MKLQEFKILLEKYKSFKDLQEQYKSTKFIKLYFRMYEYIISIPKEKIVLKSIRNDNTNRNTYMKPLFWYILCFLEAKDFYKWKNRIYSLLSEKLGSKNYKKYELLYRSKAKEFFDKIQKQTKATCIKNLGVEYPMQSKKIQEKLKTNNLKKYSKEYVSQTEEFNKKQKLTWNSKTQKEKEQIQEKRKITCMKNLGVKHPLQSKKIQDKMKATYEKKYGPGITNPSQVKEIKKKKKEKWNSKIQKEKEQIQEKRKTTMIEKYEVKYGFSLGTCTSHSKIGDKICLVIDNALGNPEDSKYATKNGEFFLNIDSKHIRKYDYCIPSKKIIVEVDNSYWHALDKNPDDIVKYPGGKLVLAKEIWAKDKEKEELAIQNGYKVYRIRDDEYRKDPKGTIEKLLEQIKEGMDI